MTYREVHESSLRLALGLRARGVRADRVAVQLPNWAEFVVVAAAVARLGAIMVPIMPSDCFAAVYRLRVNMAVRHRPKPHVTIKYVASDFEQLFLKALAGLSSASRR
jgi:acyl-CoA synthetase (AMP-forming)/AMP-acid ligase II